MCSLGGVIQRTDPQTPRQLVNDVLAMLDAMRHRGPDGVGLYVDGRRHSDGTLEGLRSRVAATPGRARVVLGQSRLAITGPRGLTGQQPFVSRDGGLALSHNGEIYNHRDLAGLVDAQDAVSDSEVLMRVLEHHVAWGGCDLEEAVRRTVAAASGMYALAVTDGRCVVLARDAIGKKPLYYVAGRDAFAWASERKALINVARDEEAPIRPLRPGRLLVCGPDLAVRQTVVERLSLPAVDVTEMDEAVAVYRRALEDAIARRTQGLDRAAVLFSGGIDSVLVARLLQRAGVDVTAYVSGVAGSSDVEHAVRIAQGMGLPLRVATVDEALVAAWLPEIMHHTELNGPLMVEVSVPMWFASKAAHEDGHRVIFTGQAADELFAGYDWYADVATDQGYLTLHARLWEDVLSLPADTLEREDRITMAWSLEMRAPFLDADVIRAAFRIAPDLKTHGRGDGHGKRPHRRLAVEVGVPHDVAYRPKLPAQDGADLHALLGRVGTRWAEASTASHAVAPVTDFGSNYRYRDTMGQYQSSQVNAMLHHVARTEGILVARPDGTAVPRPRPAAPSTVRSNGTVAGVAVKP